MPFHTFPSATMPSEKMTKQTQDPLGSGWIIISTIGFALTNFCVKAAGQQFEFSSGELVFWRMLFAMIFLGTMAKMRGDTFKTPHWKAHLNRSLVGTIAMLLLFFAMIKLPLATGVTLGYTSAIFLAIFSFIVLKERIALYTQAILLIGFIGVVVLLNPSFQSGQIFPALLGLLGGAMSGWAYMMVRELSVLGEPSWRVVFYLSVVGTIVGAIWATLMGWHTISWAAVPYLLAIGASAMVAQLCLTRAYKVGKKFTVASLSYLTVVFSALLGVWFLNDTLTWHEIMGMLIIVGSGVLSGVEPIKIKQRWTQRYQK